MINQNIHLYRAISKQYAKYLIMHTSSKHAHLAESKIEKVSDEQLGRQ